MRAFEETRNCRSLPDQVVDQLQALLLLAESEDFLLLQSLQALNSQDSTAIAVSLILRGVNKSALGNHFFFTINLFLVACAMECTP